MGRKKPKSWNGESRHCTSPYRVKKGGCLGEIDFGQGTQLDYRGHEKQRYCYPCISRMHREEEEEWERKQAEKAKKEPGGMKLESLREETLSVTPGGSSR
jgi:hypothetical protein